MNSPGSIDDFSYIGVIFLLFLWKMEMVTHFSRQPFLLQTHVSSSKNAVFAWILMFFRWKNETICAFLRIFISGYLVGVILYLVDYKLFR